MGLFVTPAGVVIEMADKAAIAVGYKPQAGSHEASKSADSSPKRKPGRPKKSE